MTRTNTRRLIFLVVFLGVALPLIFNIDLTHHATPETRQAYTNIESLPDSAIVLVSFDFEASSWAEIKPLAEVLLAHVFARNLRVVGVSLFAEGTTLGEQILAAIAAEKGREYGVDYCYLGYRPQYVAAILGMGESITAEFPADYYGAPTKNLPLFADLHNYDQVNLVISIADGSMPTYWTEYAVAPYGVNLEVALTATMATAYYPYLSSGQISGLLAGLKGAAEYELLLKQAGGGKRGLFAQSVSQVVIMLVIIAGNVADYFRRRKPWK
ncbi:MAG: hypothetical protein KAT58_05205 [candidate division Zixibacteria bacterium]|nr:hypothetical protein [candidate division Zixibacteria bacterium]